MPDGSKAAATASPACRRALGRAETGPGAGRNDRRPEERPVRARRARASQIARVVPPLTGHPAGVVAGIVAPGSAQPPSADVPDCGSRSVRPPYRELRSSARHGPCAPQEPPPGQHEETVSACGVAIDRSGPCPPKSRCHPALLRKSAFGLTVPFPVARQAIASIAALPRAEKQFMNEPCRAIGPSDNGE